jgi:hypothetical protein
MSAADASTGQCTYISIRSIISNVLLAISPSLTVTVSGSVH